MVWAAIVAVDVVHRVHMTLRVLHVASTLRTLRPVVTKAFHAATAHIAPPEAGAAAETVPLTPQQELLATAAAELEDCTAAL